ncbi:hypothetical protein [Halorussus sp. MSC15.2]|uniref:hypothetical protein n=1 Tax=Halorussus sp. MSC15.2 TaxID=2283638 RepID=UPI0013D6255F|nr:hypothetical protein [Halorussus sp. MSC15.2]NEU58907.1 hypothetical protein [Halorussus sp. MSC15.2]
MLPLQRRHRRAVSVGAALSGAFLLYWSVSALFSASYTPNTVPAVDAFLGSIDWIWLTGLGVLLFLVGVRRPLRSLSRRSRVVSVAFGAVGACLVAAWVGFVALSLSSVGGMLFFSPVLGAGGLLLSVGVSGWKSAGERATQS